ncbi:hypothetical protein [Halorubrum sp. HHNYT27]|uniref:hypothetical protein n=1 Tax=Halorubrum sp. HHNYT27 TaxID=3402275 RepID=UPI003EB6AD0B
MDRRRLLAATVASATAATGCLGVGNPDPGRLDLTVRNDGDAAVDVEVVVRGDDGTTYESATDRVDPGVARAFEATVGGSGRHEVTVTGADWEGRLAWDAGVCALYDGTVAVDAGTVAVAGECVDPR